MYSLTLTFFSSYMLRWMIKQRLFSKIFHVIKENKYFHIQKKIILMTYVGVVVNLRFVNPLAKNYLLHCIWSVIFKHKLKDHFMNFDVEKKWQEQYSFDLFTNRSHRYPIIMSTMDSWFNIIQEKCKREIICFYSS